MTQNKEHKGQSHDERIKRGEQRRFRLIKDSGIFMQDVYEKEVEKFFSGLDTAVQHYFKSLRAERCTASVFFDPKYYLEENPDVAAAGMDPLLHYVAWGENEYRDPHPLIWTRYIKQRIAEQGGSSVQCSTALGSLIELSRNLIYINPNPFFDCSDYLKRVPNACTNHLHPLLHFMTEGEANGIDPGPGFLTRAYAQRYCQGELRGSLLHYIKIGKSLGFDPTTGQSEKHTVFGQVRYALARGPHFEGRQFLIRNNTEKPRMIAYYLPQFHREPVNDEAWGTGYTEWTALAKALPRFSGHMQPRAPADLGFYDLMQSDVMSRQAEMARNAGIDCFAFYYYNMNGKKPLSAPLQRFLNARDLDIQFCLTWVNESWTRTWDGLDNEIFLKQGYDPESIRNMVIDIGRYMQDERYFRIKGRPLLIIYRPLRMPDYSNLLHALREQINRETSEEILLVGALTSPAKYLEKAPIDGIIEFPPHETFNYLPAEAAEKYGLFDDSFTGRIFDYDKLINFSLLRPPPQIPLIKTALPSWDNEPRRSGWPTLVQGSTPAKFEIWLRALLDKSRKESFFGERIVCINAWNEWAESAVLEPDLHYGYAYLNAVARALS